MCGLSAISLALIFTDDEQAERLLLQAAIKTEYADALAPETYRSPAPTPLPLARSSRARFGRISRVEKMVPISTRIEVGQHDRAAASLCVPLGQDVELFKVAAVERNTAMAESKPSPSPARSSAKKKTWRAVSATTAGSPTPTRMALLVGFFSKGRPPSKSAEQGFAAAPFRWT